MPTLFVPTIGDRLELQVDVEVGFVLEYRNDKFLTLLMSSEDMAAFKEENIIPYYDRQKGKVKHYSIIPAGTILVVDRVYIRKGAADFSSLTFRHTKADKKKTGSTLPEGRFWLNLDQINDKFIFELV